MTMLRIVRLAAGYGDLEVLHEVDLTVTDGEAVALVGSNGAGKTTLLRAVCGLLSPTAGDVEFKGRSVVGVATHRLNRAGLAYVPAERHLFAGLSVHEHLQLGAYPLRGDPGRRDEILQVFPQLGDRMGQLAGTLSGGEQQMLAIARAWMSAPELLLLDEPTTGLAPALAAELYAALARLREQRPFTLLLAEQHVTLALGHAERGYVIEGGRVRLEGTADELARDPGVRRAYFGTS